MKKITPILLLILFVLLAACGGNAQETPTATSALLSTNVPPEPAEAPAAEPVAEPVKPKWIPLTGTELSRAEVHIQEYKTWLNKGYKAGKFTKDECQIKLKHKEVEIGLRQH